MHARGAGSAFRLDPENALGRRWVGRGSDIAHLLPEERANAAGRLDMRSTGSALARGGINPTATPGEAMEGKLA